MTLLTLRILTLAALGAALMPSVAHAQCADWRAVPELARADIVSAQTVWDPDGAGPLPARLVIAGRFAVAGWPNGVNASNIASFDGVSWQPLGAGLVGNPAYSTALALAVYNGQLIAGGSFTSAGGTAMTGIARWNGSSWQPLGSGIAGNGAGSLPNVAALAVYNGLLIAAGGFDTAGGVTVHNIAAWNGTAWSALAGGTPDYVAALTVYNNQLIAGGSFDAIGGVGASRVAAWNGASWSPIASGIGATDTLTGVPSTVRALAVSGPDLIVGGRFTSAGATSASNVAAWNGSFWRALGSGLEDNYDIIHSGSLEFRGVFGLTPYNSQVIATGRFLGDPTGAPQVDVASWDGSTWSAMGDGVGSFPSYFADEAGRSVQVYGGSVYVGGVFPNEGATTAFSLARWNGSAWAPTSGVLAVSGGPVYSLWPWGGDMLLSGDFQAYVPGAFTYLLAKWNGLGIISGQVGIDAPARVMVGIPRTPPLSTDLVIAGDFAHLGGSPVGHIISYNSVQSGTNTYAGGLNGTVRAVEKFNGTIYAGGDFTANAAGTTALTHIARWNGTAWVAVGSGFNAPVYALKTYGSSLYVGGTFTSSGSTSTGGFARWDGTSVSQVGGFFGGSVYALGVYNNELVIGGQYPGINSSPNLARYNGTSYNTYATGGANAPVCALCASNNTLVVGGDFTTAGGVPALHIARWTGSAWTDVRGGADDSVYALSAFNGELHVGGAFHTMNGGAVGTQGYARFLETGVPWFAVQPVPTTATCSGASVSFTAQAAAGYSVTYGWLKNGAPLHDGPAFGGSVIAGSGTGTLTISGATTADEGNYSCIAAAVCGTNVSLSVPLTVCYANCDCSLAPPILNVADFTCFLQKYAAGNPYANCDGSTQAPTLNVSDFTCFLQRYAAGCP